MTTSTFTLLHVLISLAGIASGLIVFLGLIVGKRFDLWTLIFLTLTVATSATGFAFPSDHLTPGRVVAMISLVVLALAILAFYVLRLAGAWRPVYVVCASIALYLNVFVAVVQTFQKTPALKAIAPTQSEPPFVVAQVTVLALFCALGYLAAVRFREPGTTGAVGSSGQRPALTGR